MGLRQPTLIEWLFVTAVFVVTAAILIPGARSVGSGSFRLKVSLQNNANPVGRIRWGRTRHELFERVVEVENDDLVNWISELPQLGGPEDFNVIYDILGRATWAGWKYNVVYFSDTVIVEYTLPDGSRRHRGIPMNHRMGQQIVEIQVPAEPPGENTQTLPNSIL